MNDELAQRAFLNLFPNRQQPVLVMKYSGKFSDYNGNVRILKAYHSIEKLEFSLSKKFLESEDDVIIGIIQHLLNKVYKTKISTLEQEFYHNFIKHMNRYAERKQSNSYLEKLFWELNETYFNGLLDMPNLKFGQDSTSTLGHYNYSTDTVTISTVLQENEELLRFVLYHELLHKKHLFTTKNGRASYHTKAFREDEKKFNVPDVEKKLAKFVSRKRVRSWF
ncbi:SprT-like domain-containing protein [Candidatus Woesearchaeota archaeon]|nr:SprT-like domain-containing protein [Candidatus Woesearchaeota archaeon]